jgi:hypothetical protein
VKDDEVIWFTNPGFVNYPFQQFRRWLKKRIVVDLYVKIGSLKLISYDSINERLIFQNSRLNTISKEFDGMNEEAVIEWKPVLSQFLKMISLEFSTYKKLKQMGEFTLLRTLISTFQKHQTQKEILLRLIKVANNDYWTVRGILSNKFQEFQDAKLAKFVENYFNRNKYIWEPYEILVTKMKTRIRIIFPQFTIEPQEGKSISFGLDFTNSEVGHGAINIEVILVSGNNDGIGRIKLIEYNRKMGHLIKNDDEKFILIEKAILSLYKSIKRNKEDILAQCSKKMNEHNFIQFAESCNIGVKMQKAIISIWNREELFSTRFDWFYVMVLLQKGIKKYRMVLLLERQTGNIFKWKD